mmetsp:Transcript_49417/g.107532  ORF Transcript_49417/g.107532 Transcript_49417/m.107532 type:complete len:200 (+) Transcript_49417:1-600(+)
MRPPFWSGQAGRLVSKRLALRYWLSIVCKVSRKSFPEARVSFSLLPKAKTGRIFTLESVWPVTERLCKISSSFFRSPRKSTPQVKLKKARSEAAVNTLSIANAISVDEPIGRSRQRFMESHTTRFRIGTLRDTLERVKNFERVCLLSRCCSRIVFNRLSPKRSFFDFLSSKTLVKCFVSLKTLRVNWVSTVTRYGRVNR